MEDIWDFLRFLVCIAGLIVVFALSGFGIYLTNNLLIDEPACKAYGRMSHQETFFSLGTNCLVNYQGTWVKFDIATGNRQEITIK